MRIPRIYLDTDLHAAFQLGIPVEFDDNSQRHAVQVLRLTTGAEVILFDNQGGEYRAILAEVGKRRVTARINTFVDRNVESPLAITLIQGISRGERMDITLQKATELGVQHMIPVTTSRCGVQLNTDRRKKRLLHWQGIVTAACQQSGRTRIPTIEAIRPLADGLAANHDADTLRLILEPQAELPLRDLASNLSQPPKQVFLLIGPEGGFDTHEIKLAQHQNFIPLALGPRILRTETAGIVAITLLQSLWGDL